MNMYDIIPVGFALVFIGMILIMAGALSKSRGDVQWGVGGFIGPIPFGFASNKNALYSVAAISVILFVLFLLDQKFFIGR